MAAMAKLPVFMRLDASGGVHEIGVISLPQDEQGWLTFDRAKLAEAIRSLADEIENPTAGEEAIDAAPR